MKKLQSSRKKFIIIGAILFALIVILGITINIINSINQERWHTIAISGLDDCADDLSPVTKSQVQKTYYDYVASQLQNDNHSADADQYDGLVRSDSCHISEFQDSDGNTGYIAEFILDLPELKYSYQAKFAYAKANGPTLHDVDFGSPRLYCLPTSDLIYGSFDCAANPIITVINGDSSTMDDITNLLPYTDPAGHYNLQLVASSETKSGYTIVITYYPAPDLYLSNGGISAFRTTYRQEIESYLTSHGQTLSDYDFFEKWQ